MCLKLYVLYVQCINLFNAFNARTEHNQNDCSYCSFQFCYCCITLFFFSFFFVDISTRFTSVRVTAKYHGIKLEYQEHRHTVLDLLRQIRTKLRVWKRPYISPEAVRVLLQEWHVSSSLFSFGISETCLSNWEGFVEIVFLCWYCAQYLR